MNVEELESIVRDELRRDAANAPSGQQLRATVLDAVAGMPITDRAGRRWAVPLLVAAAVVALAIAATLLPRAFGKHSQPAHPKPSPSPSLPAAPVPVGVSCGQGQQLVTGLGTRFTDSLGKVDYAYEYYCAGPDGSRAGSVLEWFRVVDGRLAFQAPHLTFAGANQYLMSLTGTEGGLVFREYDASPGINGHPGGVISDVHLAVDAEVSPFTAEDIVGQPCLVADLAVAWTSANEPTPHQVLKLTNRSGKPCAVWGNPRYTHVAGQQRATIHSVLRGPAGGLAAGEPSAPPLLLQPGQSAYSALGTEPVNDHCFVPTFSVALPNGVQLGTHTSACAVVSYPLVRADNGSVDHPESEAPASATGSCLTATDLVITFGSPPLNAGNRVGITVTLSATGSASCTITGYPNVRALDKAGNLLQIAMQTPRSALGGLTGDRIPQLTVTSGQPASALIDWSADSASGRCSPASQLSFNLGGSGASGGDVLPNPLCDLQVHPFVAGSTGSD
jgi:hypothetical protein